MRDSPRRAWEGRHRKEESRERDVKEFSERHQGLIKPPRGPEAHYSRGPTTFSKIAAMTQQE